MADKGKKDKLKGKGKGKKARQKDTTAKAEKPRSEGVELAGVADAHNADRAQHVTQAKPTRSRKAGDAQRGKRAPGSAQSTGRSSTPRRAGSLDLAILDAALAEGAAHGFAGLTTRRIAAVAAVNEVTIFRRFGNKQALLQALFAREAQRIAQDAGAYTGDLEGDLQRIVSAFMGDAADAAQPARMYLLLVALGQGAEMRAVAADIGGTLDTVAALLARYMDERVLTQEPPLAALGALLGPALLDGAVNGNSARGLDAGALVKAFLQGRLSRASAQGGLTREKGISI